MPERTPEETAAFSEGTIKAFSDAILPAELKELRELPRRIQTTNARASIKLRQVYAVADKVYRHAEGRVACARGCAHCCHVAVPITEAEAKLIGERIGVPPASVAGARLRNPASFSGATPCTFLVNNECSIYESRPLECRSTFNFDQDSYWCRPENWQRPGASVPKPTFEELHTAYRTASQFTADSPVADIRDYFPKGLPVKSPTGSSR